MAKFSANQLKFIDWLAHGKYHREPSTQALFAATIKVNPVTLSKWKKGQNGFTEADFWQAVTNRSLEILGMSVPDTLSALKDEATKGQIQHIKTLLELAGIYTEKVEHTVYVDDARERLANRVTHIAERAGAGLGSDTARVH